MDKKVTVSFSIRSLLGIALALIVLALLYSVRSILVLFVIAYILSSAMRPFVNRLKKYHVPKPISIIGIYLVLLAILFFIFRVLVPPVAAEVDNLVANRHQLVSGMNEYLASLPNEVEENISLYVNELPGKVQNFFFSGKTFENIMGFFAGFGGILTVLFVAFYMLLEGSSFERFIKKYWPGRQAEGEKLQQAFRNVDLKVSMWVRGQVILSFSIGVLMLIGYSVLGVDYALVLALIAAFTELIPYAGPIIGAVPAVIIGFLEAPILAVWVIVLTVAVQQFEQHVLVPQVMKRAVGLSAVVVIFSLLVGAKLFGILGAIIAVPVAASIKVVYNTLNERG